MKPSDPWAAALGRGLGSVVWESDAGCLLAGLPHGEQVIVRWDVPYTHHRMLADIAALRSCYSGFRSEVIGRSVLGREIVALRVGSGKRHVHFNGSHHAREWITTPLLMRFVEDFLRACTIHRPLLETDAGALFRANTLWIVPMVNPDGVELCQEGVSETHPLRKRLLYWNKGSHDFSRWKANARGVDLNLQYRANWRRARRAGARRPGPGFHAGPRPESEPESRALADHIRHHDFRLVLAFHAQGEVIFWNYFGLTPAWARGLTADFCRLTGYRAMAGGPWYNAHGGFKDWFILRYRRPGFTIEVGHGRTPLPLAQLPGIYARNLPLLLRALSWPIRDQHRAG